MDNCITLCHHLPSYKVTKEPELVPTSTGAQMFRTCGTLEGPPRTICPECGGSMHVHAHETVRLRDIPLLGNPSIIQVSCPRHRCVECSHESRPPLAFKSAGHFLTKRLEALVMEYLALGMSIKSVHRLLGVDVHVISHIEKRTLKQTYGPPPTSYSRYIAIDEISIHRHHHYATVAMDLESGHVLFCEAGKKKEQAQHFMDFVGKDWMRHVQAVSMDMNAQYDSAFREQAPHVHIVYDSFHMLKLYGDMVLTTLRRRLQNQAKEKDDRGTYETLKGGRFILLSSRETLEHKDESARQNNRYLSDAYESKGLSLPPGRRRMSTAGIKKLDMLMAVNRELNTAYVLLEQFRLAYAVRDPDLLERGMDSWCAVAQASAIPELIAFRSTVRRHMDGIVNHARFPISSGKLEGTNNLAKVIKRTAYGFVDDEHFFLKLMHASRQPYYKPRSPRFLH